MLMHFPPVIPFLDISLIHTFKLLFSLNFVHEIFTTKVERFYWFSSVTKLRMTMIMEMVKQGLEDLWQRVILKIIWMKTSLWRWEECRTWLQGTVTIIIIWKFITTIIRTHQKNHSKWRSWTFNHFYLRSFEFLWI